MEPTCSCGGSSSSSEFNFGFAFNDPKYSDKVLRLEFMSDPVGAPSTSGSVAASKWVRHDAKRKRPNENRDEDEEKMVQESTSGANNKDVADENQEERVEESPSGANLADENAEEVEEFPSDCSSGSVKTLTLHISSAILSGKSTFFMKLFSNGMRETEQSDITLKLHASEQASFVELVKFMYTNNLDITATTEILNLLIAADKYGVFSCMRSCSQLLLKSPLTTESALRYLHLPHTLADADAVLPLINAAKQYLVGRFKDILKFKQELMALPLSGIEVILASHDLQVPTEDVVYNFALTWARYHYHNDEERRQVLDTRLAPLIRFPFMTPSKLEEASNSNDFTASKLVTEALLFKARPLHCQRLMMEKVSAPLDFSRFVERAYVFRPIKVVDFDLPQQHCIIYLDMKRDECVKLFPSARVWSQLFHLGGHQFSLSPKCMITGQQQGSLHCFGLDLGMAGNPVSFAVDWECAARSRPTEEFASKVKGVCTFTPTSRLSSLVTIPWTSLAEEDSVFFLNGVLHLRVKLTLKTS